MPFYICIAVWFLFRYNVRSWVLRLSACTFWYQIELKDASFGWEDASPTASNVNLRLEKVP